MRKKIIPLLVLAGLVAPAIGQEGGAPAKPASGTALTIPLSGLTEANAPDVEDALLGIVRPAWMCESCERVQETAGTCPDCEVEFVSTDVPVAKDVSVDPEKRVANLAVAAGGTLRLGAVEEALAETGVKVDREKLVVPGWTRLTVKGVATPEGAAAVEKALKEGRHFESATATLDKAGSQVHVVVGAAGPAPATFGAIAGVLHKAGKDATLADLSWNGPCATCAKNGKKMASCAGCWRTSP